jgi:gp16 family phage-associated protein
MSEISAAQVEAARAAFYDRGEDVASWARARGFRPANVYRVLSGQSKAKRGEGHRIAIALGLKPGTVQRLGDAPPTEAGSSQVKGESPGSSVLTYP